MARYRSSIACIVSASRLDLKEESVDCISDYEISRFTDVRAWGNAKHILRKYLIGSRDKKA